ncbi:MAG: hypothetical protein Q4G28_11570 [Neisseria sp.]|nr:hypothetical protein [Neisseria sp.]
MNAEAASAILFAAAAIACGWYYFGKGLAAYGIGSGLRRLLLGAGAAVIVLCLLYYLNLI